MKKKIIILKHGGGELANQLWNFASIYSYCVHNGYKCINPSFFQYGSFFSLKIESRIIDWVFFLPFKNYTKRRSGIRVKILKLIYELFYVKVLTLLFKDKIISSQNIKNKPFYLPPTIENSEITSKVEKYQTLYMKGWLFRNPEGMRLYRKEVLDYFKPTPEIQNSIKETLSGFEREFSNVIGIHIRQGDYKIFKDGEFLISQKRIVEILGEYIEISQLDKKKVQLVITSDGDIDENIFSEFNFFVSKKSPVEDMFLLAKCDVILGSDSSFGSFASYIGNIPHIIFKNEKMDWEYYKNKSGYFQNKYCTLLQN